MGCPPREAVELDDDARVRAAASCAAGLLGRRARGEGSRVVGAGRRRGACPRRLRLRLRARRGEEVAAATAVVLHQRRQHGEHQVLPRARGGRCPSPSVAPRQRP